jgi:hypothetical protein
VTHLFTPPGAPAVPPGVPRVFLSGSIDGPGGWRSEVMAALSHRDIAFFDPTRPSPSPDPATYIAWELAALETADLIAMYFAPGSRPALTFFELGLHAASGRLLVSCPPDSAHRPTLTHLCARFAIPLVATLPALIEALDGALDGAVG